MNRVQGHLTRWRSRLRLTRKPNLWRLVSFHHQLFFESENSGDVLNSSSSHFVISAGSSTGSIKARFENIAKQKEEEDRKRAEEERARRQAKERQEQEEARRKIEEAPKAPSPAPAPAASPSPTPSPTPPVQSAAAPTYHVS